jgi:SHS2 domain-containing protein
VPYEYLDDVAIADVAFRAWETTVEDVFTAAADALLNVMVEDVASVRPLEHRRLNVEREALDLLLFAFLGELLYRKDAEQLLLRVPRVAIATAQNGFALEADAAGEKIDPERHRTGVDVKAVTLYRFDLRRTQAGWEAFVIVDV